ncbi:hypothetical protein [Cloacibacterium normanense]
MDLENFKNNWKEEEVSTPEISLEHQHKINNPLQKIRKNMKMEFWMSVMTIIPLLFWAIFSIENLKVKLYVSMLIISMVLVSLFYFKIFYKTYQSILNTTTNTLDSLKDLLFQLKLYEQYYVSYYLSFVPFLVCELIIIYEFTQVFKVISPFLLVFNFIMILGFSLLLLYFFGKFWFNEFYGKYINQVSELIAEISGEESTINFGSNIFRTQNKINYLLKTEPFFIKTFGNRGSLINSVFWIIVFIISILLISFIIGFGIGYFGTKYNLIDSEKILYILK